MRKLCVEVRRTEGLRRQAKEAVGVRASSVCVCVSIAIKPETVCNVVISGGSDSGGEPKGVPFVCYCGGPCIFFGGGRGKSARRRDARAASQPWNEWLGQPLRGPNARCGMGVQPCAQACCAQRLVGAVAAVSRNPSHAGLDY